MYFGVVQRGAGTLQALGDGLSKLYASNLFLANFYESDYLSFQNHFTFLKFAL